MHLSRKDVVRHLGLALQQKDDKVLREHVEKLYAVLTAPDPRPNVAKHPPTWKQVTVGLTRAWRVTLHRDDAKFVEEIWQDFRARKISLDGTWATRQKDGKPLPIHKDGPLITFEFYNVTEEKPIRVRKARREKNTEKLKKLAAQASKEDLLELLKKLEAKL